MVVVALLIFSSIDKHGFHSIDVHITYALLFGTIGLDAIALFMFATSEWVVIYIDKFLKDANKKGSWRHSLCNWYLLLLEYFFSLKTIKWGSKESKFCYFDWVRKLLFGFFYWLKEILFSRWYRSLHTYNLINYCLKERHKENCSGIGLLKDFYDSIKYVSKEPVEEKLWKFIFTQLKHRKDGQPSNVGTSFCTCSNLNSENQRLSSNDFGDSYHHTVLILHIATDLCHEKNEDIRSFKVDRKISKVLSDYMLYLQVMKPALVSATLGIVKLRFHSACNDAKKLFSTNVPKMKSQKRERAKAREECLEKGAKDYKKLCKAIALVKKLEKLCPSKRWELISKLWMELLFYAAGHYKADVHIAQLNKGGELITFVWLLIAHFDMRDDFRTYKGIANIVDKYM